MSRDLLFEIGVEEIPSGPLYKAIAQLKVVATKALDDARLGYARVDVYGAPRRLAVFVTDLAERQEDVTLRAKGPSVKAAFDDHGQPTKAAEGFARGKGITVSDLVVEDVEGSDYVFAVIDMPGKSAAEVLPGLLADLITAIDWSKSMRWGSDTIRFIRPVRWLVALFGDEVVPVAYAGLTAGRMSVGHRFLAGSVEIPSADVYLDTMRGALCVVDHDERAGMIRRAIDAAAAAHGGRAVVPEKTFAEVVNLVEWPTVGVGHFDEEFLAVPREVVEEAMESHQRYFPVESPDGVLTADFIVVHNGDPERTDAIISGHERVIRARLADAAFFYREDLAHPLEAYVSRLDSIVFQERLGSLGAKVGRIETLVRALAEQVDAGPDEEAYALRAAHLSKADLVTHAVVEFTSLQGVMGQHYAIAAGEAEQVAEAIVDHYRPRFSGDGLPRTLAGKLVSVADKLDTIAGIFAIGQAPTGSADPYALRRGAIGVLAMVLDGDVRLRLDEAIAFALSGYAGTLADLDVEATGSAIKEFFTGRLDGVLRDRGHAYDTVQAIAAVSADDPADALARCNALTSFRAASDDMEDLSVAFTRAKNLAKPELGTGADVALMGVEEARLADALTEAEQASSGAFLVRDYMTVLGVLARLRAPIDAFFESVLVMDPDEGVRDNRLRLLNRFVALFSGFADFSALAG
ncbi:MAG: glycine--tRNA ligase subunit beta [Coriobacteriia bacterium]|nr:glycine--tRNA ligase subunit beta [Coriobacteriia bacterium]